MTPEEDLALSLELADAADTITAAAFGRADLAVSTKPDRSFVTEADREVEDTLRAVLAERRPADSVLGEERGAWGSGSRRWIVDPIDGTANFVRGVPVWATLIGLEDDGRITVGVASAPALGRRWWAARGAGAWTASIGTGRRSEQAEPRRLRVSAVASLADAHLASPGCDTVWAARGGPGPLVELASQVWRHRGFGDFWSHVLVAEGSCDVGLDPVVSLWDLAALAVIVEEAGGRFTDFAGQPRADGGSAISSNGLLHDQVCAILQGRAGP
jgi:histidinol-phosphatase